LNDSDITTEGISKKLDRLTSFLAQDPDNLNLLADVADIALRARDYAISRSAIKHALDLQPDDPYFKLRLSTLAISENKIEESLAITESLLQQGHNDAAIKFNHVFALVSLERFEEAKGPLTELFLEDTDFPKLAHLLIRTHHYLGEMDEAIETAHKYLDTHPDDGEIMGMLSLLYFDNDDLEQAKTYADRALKIRSNNLDALLAGGGSALGFENIEESKLLLNKALDIEPTQGRAWVTLGLIDLIGADLTKAEEHLRQAVKYMPEHIGSWHVLAWAQLLQKDIQSAESSFLTALALDNNFGETHGGLAVIAALKGEWGKAAEFSKIAKRLDPESMSPLYAQILRLEHEGRTESAQQIIDKVLKTSTLPNGSTLFEFLGKHLKR